MDNNMNMFPEDPKNNGTPDDNDDIDFGETLEDFENLIGMEDSDNDDADGGDSPHGSEYSVAGGKSDKEDVDGGEKNSTGGNDKNDKNDKSDENDKNGKTKTKEKKEFPKLKIDNRTVSGIFGGIGAWIAAVWRMFSLRTKIISISSFAALLIGIVIVVAVLNNSPYSLVIPDLNDKDFGVAASILRDNEIPYKHERQTDGLTDIHIRKTDEAAAIGALGNSGFQSPGVVFDEPASTGGMLETAEDKRQRIIRDKESRLMAGFNEIEGIAASLVMLNIPDNSKNVLAREIQPSSASVTLYLKPGVTLDKEAVRGIESLVMASVENLALENIIITDGQAHILNKYEEETVVEPGIDYISMLKIKTEYERDLERKLENNAVEFLESFYPEARAKVMVKTNFDKIIRETLEYFGANVDEETGEITGIKSAEAVDRILRGGQGDENVWGTVGTDPNVDATGYYETPLDTELGNFADEMHITHEDLVSHIMEQMERTTPEITNISLMATADGRMANGSPIEIEDEDIDQLILALAHGTGISDIARTQLGPDETLDVEFLRYNFVNLIVRPFFNPLISDKDTGVQFEPGIFTMFEFWLAVGSLMILIIMIAVILVAITRYAKKAKAAEAAAAEEEDELLADYVPQVGYPGDMDEFTRAISKSAVKSAVSDERDSEELSLEVKEENLKKQIKIFVDQNPEIAAQLIKTLLKGDEAHG